MGNDAPVVGPAAPTANSKMVKLDIATADWSRRSSGLTVIQVSSGNIPRLQQFPFNIVAYSGHTPAAFSVISILGLTGAWGKSTTDFALQGTA